MTYDEATEGGATSIDVLDDKVKDRWSRYIGAMGIEAVAQQAKATVLIIGLRGVGIEIAKNIVLAGCKELILYDPGLPSESDLSCQFFLTPEEAKGNKTMAQCSQQKLQQLNSYVKVSVSDSDDPCQTIAKADPSLRVVVLTDYLPESLPWAINQAARAKGAAFIEAVNLGPFARIFNDFGDKFLVRDVNGEETPEIPVTAIEKFYKGDEEAEKDFQTLLVTLVKGFKHKLADKDTVSLRG